MVRHIYPVVGHHARQNPTKIFASTHSKQFDLLNPNQPLNRMFGFQSHALLIWAFCSKFWRINSTKSHRDGNPVPRPNMGTDHYTVSIANLFHISKNRSRDCVARQAQIGPSQKTR
jgi:hypothetical protein